MNRKIVFFGLIFLFVLGLSGCGDNSKQPVAPHSEPLEAVIPDSTDFPEMLPAGVVIEDVKKSLEVRNDLPLGMLVPEVLKDLGDSYSPEDYYIDSSGLHWGKPKRMAMQLAPGNYYHPYGFSIVGSFHFVYWFSTRPPSYNAYMAWIPIYAQPYGSNGILVQKRDICWICGCNPLSALLWTWIREK